MGLRPSQTSSLAVRSLLTSGPGAGERGVWRYLARGPLGERAAFERTAPPLG